MSNRPRDWEELEQRIGVKRTVPVSVTRRDVEKLTADRLRGPFWKLRRKK